MFVVPPSIVKLPLFVNALPELVPKVAKPLVILTKPMFVDEKLPPFSVPPLTQMPAVAAIVGAALNCAVAKAWVSLSVPFVSVNWPDMLMGPIASRILPWLAPLLTVMELKAVVEVPLMVCNVLFPLKVTVPVPGMKVPPLLVQLLATLKIGTPEPAAG